MEKRILLVDDDRKVVETLSMILKKYNVDSVHFGEAALGILRQHEYQVILLGINMAGLDGMQVLKGIKGTGHCAEIIMLTSEDSAKTAVKAMHLGAFTYITKPFITEDIIESVEQAFLAFEKKTLSHHFGNQMTANISRPTPSPFH